MERTTTFDVSSISQIENGVGMLSSFEYEFMCALSTLDDEEKLTERNVTVATGYASYDMIRKLSDRLMGECPNLHINVEKIKNNFFGESITVSGLLTGKDLSEQLKAHAEKNWQDYKTIDYISYVFDEDGNMMIGSYQNPEYIRVYVDSQGVCQLELWNPWEEKGIITDSANMIDFEDVDEIAKSEFENYTDNYISGYTIDEVVLGYTVVRDGDSVTLVPAWYYYADIYDENDINFFKNARVIINALDGTVEHSFRY